MKNKTCTKCKKTLNLKNGFFANKARHDGVSTYCKKCHSLDVQKRVNKPSNFIALRYSTIKYGSKKRGLSLDFTRQEFYEWFDAQSKKCVYCKIKNLDIIKLKFFNSTRNIGSKGLTIDRKDSKLGYSFDNIVLSCIYCNMIKNSVLSFDEMKEIGIKYIKPKWNNLIK